MKQKQFPIKYTKERALISDVLPFEVPITFSNRHFYNFLVKEKIELKKNRLTWKANDLVTGEIIKLLFDFKDKTLVSNEIDFRSGKEPHWRLKTVPFNYRISHKGDDFRELTVVHPKNQIALVEFYESYKQLILHYCSLSPFSLRRPSRVARFKLRKDRTFAERLAKFQDDDAVEEDGTEYENLKTYFVYKDYSNIHKFYESYKYHRCEKKYNKLFKFDISKCFDSIYSHSICWALLNKEIVKDNLLTSKATFGGQFDAFMQHLNYSETNGIVIGPEFSRIFAEIILQKIDRDVESILKESHDLKHKRDYEIFRYVDDYFVFYNEESTREEILKQFRMRLRVYKLGLNEGKSALYEKPLITELTIAKQRIVDLLCSSLSYSLCPKSTPEEISETQEEAESSKSITGSIYVSSNKLITKFKTVIKETGIEYKDILNYSFAIIERRLSQILLDYSAIDKTQTTERRFIKALLEILDFTFFIYSVAPQVNTTIRLCRILRCITEYLCKKDHVNIDLKHLVLKKIFDNITFVLDKNRWLLHAQIETLFLLIALGEFGKEYWLDADFLRKHVCIEKDDETGVLSFKGDLSYFTITVLLFYMKNKSRYEDLRAFIKEHILHRLSQVPRTNLRKNTELILLLFDILTCPYLDLIFKRMCLRKFDIKKRNLQHQIISFRDIWFTQWTDFDFGKALDAKHSLEVY